MQFFPLLENSRNVFFLHLATVAYSIMTTTETSDGESAERNASRRHQNERTSPSAEGTDFQMVTFNENGTSSKQI